MAVKHAERDRKTELKAKGLCEYRGKITPLIEICRLVGTLGKEHGIKGKGQ